jgi:uncharacterized membrane protein YqjE
MSNPSKDTGLFASLRRLLGTAVGMAQVRLDILGTEVELEKRRIFDGLMLGAIALLTFGLGVALLCGLIILLFWDGYRLAAIGAMAAIFIISSAILMYKARTRLRAKSGMFSISLSELARDIAALQPASEK